MDRLELVCQDVRDGRSISAIQLPIAGGAGDFTYFEACQSRAVIRGVISAHETTITRLGGWCYNVSDSPTPLSIDRLNYGNHVLPSHGGHDTDAVLDLCPSAQALVGLNVHVSGGKLVGIQGRCADVGAWSHGTTSGQSTTPFRGQTGTLSQRTCPAQAFMVGWFVNSGDSIFGVTPICRQFGSSGVVLATDLFAAVQFTVVAPLL